MSGLPPGLIFREAGRDDVPAMVRLLADDALGRSREAVGDDVDPAYISAFEAIGQDPNNHLIVADLDGAVIGCMQLTAIPHLAFRGGTRLQIEGVRVDQAYRGRRVGAAMIDHALAVARARGCHLVQLTSNRQRPDALRFYQRLGFAPSHVGFKMDLG
ncbi:MAG: GNAT family N-acetyltransferase [Alphaproteobacteria bacterium]